MSVDHDRSRRIAAEVVDRVLGAHSLDDLAIEEFEPGAMVRRVRFVPRDPASTITLVARGDGGFVVSSGETHHWELRSKDVDDNAVDFIVAAVEDLVQHGFATVRTRPLLGVYSAEVTGIPGLDDEVDAALAAANPRVIERVLPWAPPER